MLSPPVGTDVSAVVGKNSRKNHYFITTWDLSCDAKKACRRDRIRGALRPVFCQKTALGQSFFPLGGPAKIRLLSAAGPLKNHSPWDGHEKIRLLWGDHEKNLLFGDRG